MQEAYVVTGSLTDSRTVRLDEPIPASGGKVRVIVERAELARRMSHGEFLARDFASEVWHESSR